MVKQKRNALRNVLCLGVLLALLAMGISILDRTTSSAGAVNSAASAAAQAARPWTAVASTGAVDESALDFFAFGLPPVGGSAAGYRIGSPITDPIVLRYNVTNTFDNNPNPNQPGWGRLELGSFAPPGAEVRARLYRVRPCSGQQELVCTATNNGGGEQPRCDLCQANALGPIDFGSFLYYVEVRIDRDTPGAAPRAHTLRLY